VKIGEKGGGGVREYEEKNEEGIKNSRRWGMGKEKME
jgi:hypothetical protein